VAAEAVAVAVAEAEAEAEAVEAVEAVEAEAVPAAVVAAAAESAWPASTVSEDSPLDKEEGRYSAEPVPPSSAPKKGCVRKSPAAARPA
jgi:hypothetical protein